MKQGLTIGLSLLAGAALFEVALIPGLLIGGAAVLAPAYVPPMRRTLRSAFDLLLGQRAETAEQQSVTAQPSLPEVFGVRRALVKTVTFRIIVTTLDFTTNYIVIGEFATAAGLSTFSLVAGPVFYFVHEALWNHLVASGSDTDLLPFLRVEPGTEAASGNGEGLSISRPLAKTITFRAIATVMDFATNYVFVGDVITAVGLSAVAFILGPFVYLGHEMAWDLYSPAEIRNNPVAGTLVVARNEK